VADFEALNLKLLARCESIVHHDGATGQADDLHATLGELMLVYANG